MLPGLWAATVCIGVLGGTALYRQPAAEKPIEAVVEQESDLIVITLFSASGPAGHLSARLSYVEAEGSATGAPISALVRDNLTRLATPLSPELVSMLTDPKALGGFLRQHLSKMPEISRLRIGSVTFHPPEDGKP